MTKKGQITIPAVLREEFNLKPGKVVVFIRTKDGLLIKPKTGSIKVLKRILGSGATIEEIEAAVEETRGGWRIDSDGS